MVVSSLTRATREAIYQEAEQLIYDDVARVFRWYGRVRRGCCVTKYSGYVPVVFRSWYEHVWMATTKE